MKIGNFAFSLWYKLKNITVLSSVTSIGENPFSSWINLQFNVSDNNTYYCNDGNGVLYNINKAKQISYPTGSQTTNYIILSYINWRLCI